MEKGTFEIEMWNYVVVIEAAKPPQKQFANFRLSQITLAPQIWTLVTITTGFNVVAEFALLLLGIVSR